MACHEVAALRLGLMGLLGIRDENERQHELAELGDGASKPGPIQSMCSARDFNDLKVFFESSLGDLEKKISVASPGDPKLPYLKTLMVFTKKVELDLSNHLDGLQRFYRDLDEMHDFVHELYPVE